MTDPSVECFGRWLGAGLDELVETGFRDDVHGGSIFTPAEYLREFLTTNETLLISVKTGKPSGRSSPEVHFKGRASVRCNEPQITRDLDDAKGMGEVVEGGEAVCCAELTLY